MAQWFNLIHPFSEITVSDRQSVQSGEAATITCAVTNNDATPSITWSNSGGAVVDDSNFDITSSAGRSTLVVKAVSSSTPLTYTCTMTFDQTPFEIEAEITAFGFSVADVSVYGIDGKDVIIPCKFESDSSTITSATIQKLVSSIWTSQSDSVFSTSGSTTSASLTISTADSSNEGQFRCSVTDSDGLTINSDSFTLDIFGESWGKAGFDEKVLVLEQFLNLISSFNLILIRYNSVS